MARFALPCILGVTDAARVRHFESLNITTQNPIPTPEGFEFNLGMVQGCYAAGNAVATASANVPPAGYKVNKGQKCPGTWLERWSDGKMVGYGNKEVTNILKCAQKCNEYPECAGFHTQNGVCSHWRSGELQDTEGTIMEGLDCFVKWEVRDLSNPSTAVIPVIPDFSDFVPGTVVPPQGQQVSDCLCVWDVDRTLTAKQGWQDRCPGTKHYPQIRDYAYNGGTLILSELAQTINQTFCGQCYFGVVSAGTASGPNSPNRDLIDSLVDPKLNVGDWVDGCPIPTWGTKVLCCDEGLYKKQAITDIVQWLAGNGIRIAVEKVHFFDDKVNNIKAMGEGPPPYYNSHQVSCGVRDGSRGGCGGVISEVQDTPGQNLC